MAKPFRMAGNVRVGPEEHLHIAVRSSQQAELLTLARAYPAGQRPSFREIVASLRTMAAALRPARRSSALGLPPGGSLGEAAAAKPTSEPSSPSHQERGGPAGFPAAGH